VMLTKFRMCQKKRKFIKSVLSSWQILQCVWHPKRRGLDKLYYELSSKRWYTNCTMNWPPKGTRRLSKG
jgi:hypothetical protein